MQSNANEATDQALKLEQLEIDEIAISSFFVAAATPSTPPGVTNLRKIPRRPGAPAATPALINSLSDQCGSACAAPGFRPS